jgi:rubrerythrin
MRIDFYRQSRAKNDALLLEQFQEDYEGWTQADFETLDQSIRNGMRDILFSKGVHSRVKHGRISKKLEDILQQEQWHTWTAKELEGKQFAELSEARRYQKMVEDGKPVPIYGAPARIAAEEEEADSDDDGAEESPLTRSDLRDTEQTTFPTSHRFRDPLPKRAKTPLSVPPLQPPVPLYPVVPSPAPTSTQSDTLPPQEAPYCPVDPKLLILFTKLWRKEYSYTGKAYDILDDKVRKFTMMELRKLAASRRVNDALSARNGPNVAEVSPMNLELGSEVRVYREGKG